MHLICKKKVSEIQRKTFKKIEKDDWTRNTVEDKKRYKLKNDNKKNQDSAVHAYGDRIKFEHTHTHALQIYNLLPFFLFLLNICKRMYAIRSPSKHKKQTLV